MKAKVSILSIPLIPIPISKFNVLEGGIAPRAQKDPPLKIGEG